MNSISRNKIISDINTIYYIYGILTVDRKEEKRKMDKKGKRMRNNT